MRTLARTASLAILIVTSLVAAARAAPEDVDRPFLTASELARYGSPYVGDIRGCYLAHATSRTATGELRLSLIIAPGGHVFSLAITAPGVGKRALRAMDACIRAHAEGWQFPVRRGFTPAELPFLFVRAVRAPGPFPSCWSRMGCGPGRASATGTAGRRVTPG